jgi:hypothetical protein
VSRSQHAPGLAGVAVLALLGTGTGMVAPAAAPAAAQAVAAERATATGGSTRRTQLAALVKLAEARGTDARLPPHVLSVLGLGAHVAGLAVHQLALHEGSKVRTFNLGNGNGSGQGAVLVILTHDEASRTTDAYALSTSGRLRKAVHYVDGGPPDLLQPASAASAFNAELDYWLAIARSAPPASR